MSRCGIEVEECRMSCIFRLKDNLTVAPAKIESLLKIEFIYLVVNAHDTCTAYVEDTQLSASKEKWSFERIDSFQRESLIDRHCATYNHAIVHRIHHVDFICSKHFFNQKILAQTSRVVRFGILRIGCITKFVVCFHVDVIYIFFVRYFFRLNSHKYANVRERFMWLAAEK